MKKIIWAVDPFNMDPKVAKLYFPVIKNLCAPGDTIHPTYVASVQEFRVVGAFDIPDHERYSSYPKKTLEQFLDKAGLKSLKANILCEWCNSISSREIALAFNKLALRNNGTIIVAFSQNKTTYQRFFLGSFAETLLSYVTLPFLLLRPGRPAVKFKTAMYCSDLEDDLSSEANEFQFYINELRLKAGIFFHVTLPFFRSGDDTPSGQILSYREEISRKLKTLKELFKGRKIKVSFASESAPIVSLIEKEVRKSKVDLLITRSKSGFAAGLLLGSIKRQLIRKSSLPILSLPVKKKN